MHKCLVYVLSKLNEIWINITLLSCIITQQIFLISSETSVLHISLFTNIIIIDIKSCVR